jgi:hypothetical protein
MTHCDKNRTATFYTLTILFTGGLYPNKRHLGCYLYSLCHGRPHYACLHGISEGIGASLVGPLLAIGNWQIADVIGGSVLALALLLYYSACFVRLDGPEPAMQSATAS